MEFVAELDTGDGTASFVVGVNDIEISDFGVGLQNPFLDGFGVSRQWSDAAEPEFAAGNDKNVFFG